MEHLLRPRNPLQPLEYVPYYSTQPYDGEGFLYYPLRMKWVDENDDIPDEIFQRPKEEVSQFIQAYLWFGLGQEVLGPDFNEQNFVRTRSCGERVLTTTKLPELAKRWAQSQGRQTEQVRDERYQILLLCLQRTQQTLTILGESRNRDKIDGCVERAVVVLGEYLSLVIKAALLPQGLKSTTTMNHWYCGNFGPAAYYEKLFENSQWCISEWGRLSAQTHSIAGIHYYSNLDAPMADKCHDACTADLCKAYQIDKSVYKTKHTIKDCNCQKIQAEAGRVEGILANDSFPILRLHTDSTSPHDLIELQAESWKNGAQYVAISHVWADGMGDPNANELPACQLRKVQEFVDSLPRADALSKVSFLTPSCNMRKAYEEMVHTLIRDQMDSTGHGITKIKEDIVAGAFSLYIQNVCGDKKLLEAAAKAFIEFMQNFRQHGSGMELAERLIEMGKGLFPTHFASVSSSTLNTIQTMGQSALAISLGNTTFLANLLGAAKAILSMLQAYRLKIKEKGVSDAYHVAAILQIVSEIEEDPENSEATEDPDPKNEKKHSAFWIDTICCPVVPDVQGLPDAAKLANHARLSALKNKSIAKLKQVYEEATHVLVIDSYLQSVQSEDVTDLEILMRIFASGWTRRLWTLQEGVLAKNLWFQFADAAVDFDALTKRWRLYGDVSFQEGMFLGTIQNCIESILAFRHNEGFSGRSYAHRLANALRCRSVSVPSDEALAVANLLDVDLSKVFEKQVKPNMKHIWEAMDTVPAGVVFARGSRIKEPGYRWATSTFLGLKAEVLQRGMLEQKPGRKTPEGLQVQLRGFEFVGGRAALPADIMKKNHHFHFYIAGQDDQETTWYCCWAGEHDELFENTAVDHTAYNLMALALAEEPTQVETYQTDNDKKLTIRRHLEYMPALFCSVDRSRFYSEQKAYARSQTLMSVLLMSDGHNHLPQPCWTEITDEVDARMRSEIDQGLLERHGTEKDEEEYRQRRRQIIRDAVACNPAYSKNDDIVELVQEYYEVWRESGFGIEVVRMVGDDESEVTWIVD